MALVSVRPAVISETTTLNEPVCGAGVVFSIAEQRDQPTCAEFRFQLQHSSPGKVQMIRITFRGHFMNATMIKSYYLRFVARRSTGLPLRVRKWGADEVRDQLQSPIGSQMTKRW